jgi:hypothetical protein
MTSTLVGVAVPRDQMSPRLGASSLGQVVEVPVRPVLGECHKVGIVGQKLVVSGTAAAHVFGVKNFFDPGIHRPLLGIGMTFDSFIRAV